jgi:uncharacterized RDD family membrane protein YckC
MKSVSLGAAAAGILSAALVMSAAGHARAGQPSERGPRASVSLTRVAGAHAAPLIEIQDTFEGWSRSVLRVGQDYTLKQGESIRELISVFGPVVIEGQVRGDVTVVFGTVSLGPTAVIEGSLVAVGGNVTVQTGAAVLQDLVVIGGGLDAPPGFGPGRQQVAIGTMAIADRLHDLIPWLTEGLLLGRPIVPRLPWVWLVVAVSFIVSVVLAMLFASGVRQSADAIATRPFTTFLVGLLVLLLVAPVSIVLIVSVVGVLVVPFALSAVVIAAIIGKIAVAVRLGDTMTGQEPPATRAQLLRSLVLGFAVICFIYMVPVLGFIAWGVVGVTGLGAATLAFASAYRRENPARPKPIPPSPPPTAPTPSTGEGEDRLATPAFVPETPPAAPLSDGAAAAVAALSAAGRNLLGFPRAGFLERAAAFALDTTFVLIICAALGFMDRDGPGLVILTMLAYHIGFWAWKGTTFGGIVCQLRVIRLDGAPLRGADALVRGIAGIFSLAVLGLGWLWIVRDEERQSWHDKIAGTYVVHVPRNWPIS